MEQMSEPYPLVIHYGLTWNVGDYGFDKHWYKNSHLDMTKCPGLLWPKPPSLDQIPFDAKENNKDYHRNEIMVEALQFMYEGLRQHHLTVCGEEGVELERIRVRVVHVDFCLPCGNGFLRSVL